MKRPATRGAAPGDAKKPRTDATPPEFWDYETNPCGRLDWSIVFGSIGLVDRCLDKVQKNSWELSETRSCQRDVTHQNTSCKFGKSNSRCPELLKNNTNPTWAMVTMLIELLRHASRGSSTVCA